MKQIVFLGVGANKQKSAGWTNSHYATVVWMQKKRLKVEHRGKKKKKREEFPEHKFQFRYR